MLLQQVTLLLLLMLLPQPLLQHILQLIHLQLILLPQHLHILQLQATLHMVQEPHQAIQPQHPEDMEPQHQEHMEPLLQVQDILQQQVATHLKHLRNTLQVVDTQGVHMVGDITLLHLGTDELFKAKY